VRAYLCSGHRKSTSKTPINRRRPPDSRASPPCSFPAATALPSPCLATQLGTEQGGGFQCRGDGIVIGFSEGELSPRGVSDPFRPTGQRVAPRWLLAGARALLALPAERAEAAASLRANSRIDYGAGNSWRQRHGRGLQILAWNTSPD
jgi:hypothetical protein